MRTFYQPGLLAILTLAGGSLIGSELSWAKSGKKGKPYREEPADSVDDGADPYEEVLAPQGPEAPELQGVLDRGPFTGEGDRRGSLGLRDEDSDQGLAAGWEEELDRVGVDLGAELGKVAQPVAGSAPKAKGKSAKVITKGFSDDVSERRTKAEKRQAEVLAAKAQAKEQKRQEALAAEASAKAAREAESLAQQLDQRAAAAGLSEVEDCGPAVAVESARAGTSQMPAPEPARAPESTLVAREEQRPEGTTSSGSWAASSPSAGGRREARGAAEAVPWQQATLATLGETSASEPDLTAPRRQGRTEGLVDESWLQSKPSRTAPSKGAKGDESDDTFGDHATAKGRDAGDEVLTDLTATTWGQAPAERLDERFEDPLADSGFSLADQETGVAARQNLALSSGQAAGQGKRGAEGPKGAPTGAMPAKGPKGRPVAQGERTQALAPDAEHPRGRPGRAPAEPRLAKASAASDPYESRPGQRLAADERLGATSPPVEPTDAEALVTKDRGKAAGVMQAKAEGRTSPGVRDAAAAEAQLAKASGKALHATSEAGVPSHRSAKGVRTAQVEDRIPSGTAQAGSIRGQAAKVAPTAQDGKAPSDTAQAGTVRGQAAKGARTAQADGQTSRGTSSTQPSHGQAASGALLAKAQAKASQTKDDAPAAHGATSSRQRATDAASLDREASSSAVVLASTAARAARSLDAMGAPARLAPRDEGAGWQKVVWLSGLIALGAAFFAGGAQLAARVRARATKSKP